MQPGIHHYQSSDSFRLQSLLRIRRRTSAWALKTISFYTTLEASRVGRCHSSTLPTRLLHQRTAFTPCSVRSCGAQCKWQCRPLGSASDSCTSSRRHATYVPYVCHVWGHRCGGRTHLVLTPAACEVRRGGAVNQGRARGDLPKARTTTPNLKSTRLLLVFLPEMRSYNDCVSTRTLRRAGDVRPAVVPLLVPEPQQHNRRCDHEAECLSTWSCTVYLDC
ncbi:hypothetical protein FA95DRAFT_647875 [Auriscalpium vulgare]|uniref:Uncharacterized protein n=1 Tax=Auriscalpium vulgare TaxID=40419 RepID=A0ACB8RDA1_9AGAM|nr:hypothetical protein FA95DRAFT_647875 [Auriscalpium vulgare]